MFLVVCYRPHLFKTNKIWIHLNRYFVLDSFKQIFCWQHLLRQVSWLCQQFCLPLSSQKRCHQPKFRAEVSQTAISKLVFTIWFDIFLTYLFDVWCNRKFSISKGSFPQHLQLLQNQQQGSGAMAMTSTSANVGFALTGKQIASSCGNCPLGQRLTLFLRAYVSSWGFKHLCTLLEMGAITSHVCICSLAFFPMWGTPCLCVNQCRGF